MVQSRRRQLSQNFLVDRKLIAELVGKSSIGKTDTVFEIGPGKGFLTRELLRVAGSVVAVELDLKLVWHLRKFFQTNPNLWVFHQDILDFPLPQTKYKVFSNIPYSIEGKIVRHLLDSDNPPEDIYLTMRSELAERLSGLPHENKFSLLHKPWWEFAIVYRFKRSDFVPAPKVDSVLWRMRRRSETLIADGEKRDWERLIEVGFGEGESLGKNLKELIGEKELGRMCRYLKIDPETKPSYLSLEEWLGIYKFVKALKQESPNRKGKPHFDTGFG